jgi:cytochrome c peroxidase
MISLVSAAAIGPLAETIDSEPITPVPPVAALDPAKIELGQKMFHDARLSGRNDVACASCHDLARGGVDGRARSPATNGGLLDFNTLTVFNAALNAQLNWRGNFRTLKEQIGTVLLDPRLMNATWPELLAKLRADAEYRAAFKALYGGELEREQVLDALVAHARCPLRSLFAW